jgi:hypothetical protein
MSGAAPLRILHDFMTPAETILHFRLHFWLRFKVVENEYGSGEEGKVSVLLFYVKGQQVRGSLGGVTFLICDVA